jgi:hypothetical protein
MKKFLSGTHGRELMNKIEWLQKIKSGEITNEEAYINRRYLLLLSKSSITPTLH